jgi:hypothetical protein
MTDLTKDELKLMKQKVKAGHALLKKNMAVKGLNLFVHLPSEENYYHANLRSMIKSCGAHLSLNMNSETSYMIVISDEFFSKKLRLETSKPIGRKRELKTRNK